jgi:hypothetical protein
MGWEKVEELWRMEVECGKDGRKKPRAFSIDLTMDELFP